ncbi:UNVERIFIED_CONTAM: hypothetical protein FKN15_046056 [Acipenser sinensis]
MTGGDVTAEAGRENKLTPVLQIKLAIAINRDQKDWDHQLPLILLVYQTAVQESTGCTPALLTGLELQTGSGVNFRSAPETALLLGSCGSSQHGFVGSQYSCSGQLNLARLLLSGQLRVTSLPLLLLLLSSSPEREPEDPNREPALHTQLLHPFFIPCFTNPQFQTAP